MRINVGLVVAASITISCTAETGAPKTDDPQAESPDGVGGGSEATNGEPLPTSDEAEAVVVGAKGMARPGETDAARRRREHSLFARRRPGDGTGSLLKSAAAGSFLGRGAAESFVRVGNVVRPNFGGKVERSFDYDLPSRADGVMHVRGGGVAAGVRLVGASHSPAEASKDGFLVYRNALDGGHVLHRAGESSDEDFVVVDRDPGNSELAYELTLDKGVAGVRVVSNAIELLDAKGVPRVRMAPPYLVDANRQLQFLNVEVTGCNVDTSPTIPWERPLTRPGASSCTIHVKWNAASVKYPILVDPSWSTTASMSVPRDFHTATTLTDGRVLVVGGEIVLGEQEPDTGTEWLLTHKTAEIYDPLFGVWTQTATMHHHRQEHVAIRLSSRRVLVAGGWNPTTGDLVSAELYDPATGTWTDVPNVPGGGSRSSLTLLPDNSALFAGGSYYDTGLEHAASARYSESTNLWTTTSPLNTARGTHTANLLPSGKVLVAGSYTASTRFSAELFDPSTGTWTATGSLVAGRGFHISALLSTGKVLAAGGSGPGAVYNTAELYDPTTQTWSAAPAMSSGHSGNNFAVTLSNGKVLVAGGAATWWPAPTTTTVAELYDPATNTWSSTTSLNVLRGAHTANMLPGGTVLVAGGYRWHGPGWLELLNTTDTAEIYQP